MLSLSATVRNSACTSTGFSNSTVLGDTEDRPWVLGAGAGKGSHRAHVGPEARREAGGSGVPVPREKLMIYF